MQFSGTLGLEYSYGESFFGQLSVFHSLRWMPLVSRYLVGMTVSRTWADGRLASLIGGGLVMRGSRIKTGIGRRDNTRDTSALGRQCS